VKVTNITCHYTIPKLQRGHSLATGRLRELPGAIGSELAGADWHRRREIIWTLVQRIDIDTEVIKIILRVTQNTRRFGF
jgi:hypothetical protein